jgi:hypothetical protein
VVGTALSTDGTDTDGTTDVEAGGITANALDVEAVSVGGGGGGRGGADSGEGGTALAGGNGGGDMVGAATGGSSC